MKITSTSLFDKINTIESELNFFKKITENYSDAEILEIGGKNFYASSMVLQKAIDIKFLVYKVHESEKHSISIYKDININDKNIRIYGKDEDNKINFPLFTIINNKMTCFSFIERLEKYSVSNIILKQIYIYIIDMLKSKNKINLESSNLPQIIKQSLIFS